VAPHKASTPDWQYVDWHYKGLHALGGIHNLALRVRVKGLDNIPRDGPVLLAANHHSFWDGILLQVTQTRPVGMLVRHEIMASRFGNWFFGRGGGIPVNRAEGGNQSALEQAEAALRDGRILAVFLEGGRSLPLDQAEDPYLVAAGRPLGRPKSGLARLALASGAPVVPVGMLTDKWWPRENKIPDLRQPIYLNFGEPQTFAGEANDRDRVAKVGDDVMHRIKALLDAADAARAAGEKWPNP